MAAITDRTIKNGMIALERKTIDDLRGRLRGTILLPGVPGYNEARSLWNGIVDRRPALIARCTNVTDVIAAVNFGREQNLVIAIKGGGHNVTGNAMCGDGIVIDVIVERAWRFRSPRSYTLLPHMGGASARPGRRHRVRRAGFRPRHQHQRRLDRGGCGSGGRHRLGA